MYINFVFTIVSFITVVVLIECQQSLREYIREDTKMKYLIGC